MQIIRNNLPSALRYARTAKGLTQEDFGLVSSRTYISSLERSQKCATLSKVDQLAEVLGIHPLTLLTLAYSDGLELADAQRVQSLVSQQLAELLPIK